VTVLHETAHYFGYTERQLRRMGLAWSRAAWQLTVADPRPHRPRAPASDVVAFTAILAGFRSPFRVRHGDELDGRPPRPQSARVTIARQGWLRRCRGRTVALTGQACVSRRRHGAFRVQDGLPRRLSCTR